MSSEQFSSQRPAPSAPMKAPTAPLTAKQKKKQEEEAQAESRRKLIIRAALALLLLLLIGTAYALFGPNEVADAKARIERVKNDAELTQQEKWQKIREIRGDLSPEAQNKVGEEDRERFRKAMDERLKTFFAKSKEQQRKELRDEILAEEKRSKEREARNGGAGGGQGGRGGAGANGGQGGAGGRGGAPGGDANAQNGPGGTRGSKNSDERTQARDVRWQQMPAEDHAMMASFRIMKNQVRQEMGLPPQTGRGGMGIPGGFGGFGGPPGGRGGPRGGGGPPPQLN
jgi:hypothetical protein